MRRTLLFLALLLSFTSFAQADLVVTNTDFSSTYIPGTSSIYTVTIINYGPQPALNVNVTNAIPAGITYFKWQGNGASGENVGLNNVIPSLAVGSMMTYVITLEVPAAFTGNLTSQTNVTSTTPDPNPGCTACIDVNTKAIGANIDIINTDNTDLYIPGASSVYTVTVMNNGPLTAANVHVHNAIPAGITNFSWVGSNGSSGTNVPVNDAISTLLANKSVVYTITIGVPIGFTGNLVNETTWTTPTTDPVDGCTRCTDTNTEAIGADLEITNTNNQTTYIAGTTTVYTVKVKNNGPLTATNVNVSNAIPAGITSFSWTGSNGSSGTNVPLNNTIPYLVNGQTMTYLITVDIPASYSGDLTSATVVTSSTLDPTPACPSCIDTDTKVWGADLVITNTNNQEIYFPGTTTIYTVTVKNNGPLAAANVLVSNAIPAGITSFSWTGSNGSSGTNVALNNTIPSLANGQTVTYTITVDIPASYTGTLTSETVVTSISTDPTAACPNCIDVTSQAIGADLEIINTNNQTSYIPGTTTVYTVTVTNNGPLAATNVVVSNAIPLDPSIFPAVPVEIVNFSWTGSNGSFGTNVPLYNIIPTLASGQTVTYTITMVIPPDFAVPLISQTIVTSDTPDPTPNCPRCIDVDLLSQGADLVVNLSDTDVLYYPGATPSVYTLIVTNNGPENAVNVVVSTLIPADITTINWTASNGSSGTGTLNNIIPLLANGASVTYTITVEVPLSFDGDLVIQASAISDTLDIFPGCQNCTDTNTRALDPHLIASINTSSTTYSNGQTITYQVSLTNTGQLPATNAVFSFPLPAGIPATSMTWTGFGGPGTGGISTTFPSFAVGNVVTYNVTIQVPLNFDITTNLLAAINVTSDTPDVDPSCECSVSLPPLPLANVVTFKSNGQTQYLSSTQIVNPDGTITLTPESTTYNITITNLGPNVAENVVVYDPLPNGIAQMTWTGSNGTSGIGELVDSIGNLAVGQVVQYLVTIVVPINYEHTHVNLTNTVFVTSSTVDPVPACPGCTDTDTPRANFVTVKPSNTYTAQQLVKDILIHSDCANVSNFVVQGPTGVSYFNRNNSEFALKEGVIIRAGNAAFTQGPFTGANGSTVGSNMGDTQLQTISNNQGGTQPIMDASSLSFDFVPLTDNFSFKFLFSSNEYGTWQCTYGDVFAFILTDLTAGGAAQNVAVIPELLPPTKVAVTTVRNSLYNGACASVNPFWFDRYNTLANAATSTINMIGQAKPMVATATVVPNHVYRIKLVIGDYQDTNFDSAVFIEGGSFNIGQASITGTDDGLNDFSGVEEFTLDNGAALCAESTRIIRAGTAEIPGATYTWFLNDIEIPGATEYTLVVSEGGIYTVQISIGGAGGCAQTDSMLVEFLPAIPFDGDPVDLYGCGSYNLYENDAVIIGSSDPDFFSIGYHHTLVDAQNVGAQVANPANYNGTAGEIIYVSIQDVLTNCVVVRQFTLLGATPALTAQDMQVCAPVSANGFGSFDFTPQIAQVLGINPAANFNVTFHNTLADANAGLSEITPYVGYLGQNDEIIYVRMEDVTNAASYCTSQFTLFVSTLPNTVASYTVQQCEDYELPVLPAGNAYYTQTNHGGSMVPAGTIISGTDNITQLFIYASSPDGVCTSENIVTFIFGSGITIPVDDVVACDNYQLPTLSAGLTYHSAAGGAPATLITNTLLNSTQIVYIYSESGGCVSEANFNVTINQTPAVPTVADVTQCDCYTLPALPAGQTYHSATGGAASTLIPVGTQLCSTTPSTQQIFVFASSGTTPACTSEGSFTLTLNPTPAVVTMPDVVACDSYTLPALPAGSTYHPSAGGVGAPIAVGTVITTSQTIYIYTQSGTTPNCAVESSFTVTINTTPAVPTVADVTQCDCYTLPALPAGQSYHSATGGGASTLIPVGTQLCSTTPSTQQIFVFAQTSTTPNCSSENSFTLTLNPTPVAVTMPNVVACDSYTLPALPAGTTYHPSAGGVGAPIAVGTVITTSQTIYIYTQSGTTPNCTAESSFTITINVTPATPIVADVSVCDSYTLPALPAGSTYHLQPNGGGAPLTGTITSTQLIYVFAQTATNPNCVAEASFTVTVNNTPQVDTPADVVACDSYVLPALSVGNYFSAPNAGGTPYFAGDVITSSMTIYVYAETGSTPNCSTQSSFSIGIFFSPTIVNPTSFQTCDDNTDGIACFNLADKTAEIIGAQTGLTVTYHETQQDAQNGVNAITGALYCNIVAGIQTLYVRVTPALAPQCASFTTLVLIVNPKPVVSTTPVADYALCDVTNPGDLTEGFDLTTMTAGIVGAQTGITVTYHTSQADAQSGSSPIDTSVLYQNTSPTQQICARLTNNATGCFNTICFNLVVNPLPLTVAIPPIAACSNGVTNVALFDLESYSGAISGNENGVQVSYYLSLANAQSATGALVSPYQSGPTTLFVRVENVDTGCFDTTSVQLIVNEGPIAMTPSPLTYCDPNNDCIGVFNLHDADLEISGGALQPGVTITYHETETDALTGANPIISPYSNIDPCLQIVYVRVQYDFTGCTNFTQLQLIVNPTPVANHSATALQVCDDNTDGIACFNLNLATENILNGLNPADFAVTYHVSQANAQAATGAITNLLCYRNTTPNTQTIWVRVQNRITGCFDVVSLQLIVNPLPTVAFPIPSYTLCDINLPGNQQEEFDLGSQIPMILNGQSGMQVTFHLTAADAQQGISALPLLYTGGPVKTLHVRVENIDTGCFATSTMDIRVEPLPAPIPPLASNPLLNVCDTNGDGIAEFDLAALITNMQQGGNFSIAFYETEQDALTNQAVNQLASPYTNTTAHLQVIWVTATNNLAPFCTSIFSIVLNVTDSPVIGPDTLQDLRVCDTGINNQDGKAVFNLTVQNANLLADQTGPASQYAITYYTSLAAAQAGTGRILNPQAFTNTIAFSQEIWVRIADSNSVCVGIGSFMIYVDSPLVLATPTPLAICDDVAPGPNPTAVFDLTVKNNEITGNNPGYTVTYFVTQADQLANNNPIQDPTAYQSLAAAQTLYVAVTGAASGCRSFTTLTIRVLPLPTPRTDLSNLGLHACDESTTASGTAEFNLTVNEAYMANGDPNLIFSYFASLEDAMEPTNAIADPSAYVSETGTIFIRVNKTPAVDYQGNNCYVIVEMQITVNTLPVLNPLVTIQGCDAIGNGTATFNLQAEGNELVLDEALDVADYTFTYHSTLADAENGSSVLPNMYTSGPTTIFVRVQHTVSGCFAVAEVELTVLVGATITNPDPAVDPLVSCADQGDEDNNSATFDLTVLDSQLLGATQTAPDFVVDYYANMQDAQDDLPISGYTNYLGDTGFVYATVTNTQTGCRSAIIAIPVTVEPLALPVIESLSGGNTICVDFLTNTFASGQTLTSGYTASPNHTFQWFLDGVEIAGATSPSYVIDTVAPGNYTVVMTSNSALACETVSAGFTVIKSGAAVIAPGDGIGWTVTNAFESVQDLIINISGFGNYEYSLDYGPFQASNVFTNISAGSHFVTVKDKNNTSCGPDLVISDIQAINYPHYFTPNGDGINDTWNIWSLRGDASAKIYIFDRYGKLIKQISPEGTGWNGTFNGKMLPADDYWFKVIYTETNLIQPDPNNPDINLNDLVKIKEFKAHFSLKR